MIRKLVGAAAGLGLIAAMGACNISATIGNNAAGADDSASLTRHFVNSREYAQSATLREHYVDFSFDYPSRWSVTPQPINGTAQNYVRVSAPMINGYEPFAFAVGSAWGSGDPARDRDTMEAGTLALAARFGADLADYRIVSTGPGRIGGYDSYGWRFTATAPGVRDEPPVRVWGRGDIILSPGEARGVTLITLATSRNREVDRVEDLGNSGTLKALHDSFRLGTGGGESAGIASPAG